MKPFHVLLVTLAPALAGGVSHAQFPMTLIHSEVPSSPTSEVPFALDLGGNPAMTRFKALEDYYVSPDGSLWILRARTEQGSDLENILLLGSGSTTLMNFAQEGQPIPGGAPGELFDFFGSGGGRFNSLNHFAYSARARGGVAAVFQKVLLWDGVATTLPFQMGDLYFGLLDLDPNPSGDETIGNSIGSIHLLDNGVIGSQDSTILNIHTSRRPAITYDRNAFHQTNVTMVTGLGGTGMELIKTLSANTFYTATDGSHWVTRGQIQTGSTADDDVLIVDDEVVLQEGSPVPGSTLLLGSIFDSGISPAGTWYARGRDSSSSTAAAPDWAVVDGNLIAETGQNIDPGSSENYGDTFFAFTANNHGDWALAGNTDAADAAADNVIVVNGTVVAREGDPVDLDGNGMFDDDVYLGRGNDSLASFKANALYLTDDGVLFAIVYLRDGMGNDLGSMPSFGTPDAFVTFDVSSLVTQDPIVSFCPGDDSGTPCPCGNTGAPGHGCENGTGTGGALLSASGSASIGASDLALHGTGLEPNQPGLYFQGSNAVAGGAGEAFGDGLRCAAVDVVRLEIVFADGMGESSTTVDIGGDGGVGPGDVRYYQLWYRNPSMSPCGSTFNLSNGIGVTWGF